MTPKNRTILQGNNQRLGVPKIDQKNRTSFMDVPLAQIHFVDIAAQLAFSSPNQMERKLITLHLLGIHFPRSNYAK